MIISNHLPWLLPALTAFLAICVWTKKLTIGGSITAVVVGILVLFGGGISGGLMLLTFFALAVLATSHKKTVKAQIHPRLTEINGRTAGQVFANGGMAGILSMLAILFPAQGHLFILMLAASLASALADTLSSELGIIYGRRFFNIITLKKDGKGLDGVISMEGTSIGIAGALTIALIYSRAMDEVIVITLAGAFGNIVDSVLGAILERRGVLGNNSVNFLNTLSAALFALLGYYYLV